MAPRNEIRRMDRVLLTKMRTLDFILNGIEAFKDLLAYWPSLIYIGIAEEPGGSEEHSGGYYHGPGEKWWWLGQEY